MGFCPLVAPETVRVNLSHDQWVELAKELTAGEYREMFAAQYKDTPMGQRPSVDLRQIGLSRILAYVKEWSYEDFAGKPLPITADWLRKFSTSAYDELSEAVEKHHEASERAIEARKNVPAGVTTSS